MERQTKGHQQNNVKRDILVETHGVICNERQTEWYKHREDYIKRHISKDINKKIYKKINLIKNIERYKKRDIEEYKGDESHVGVDLFYESFFRCIIIFLVQVIIVAIVFLLKLQYEQSELHFL